MLIDDTSSGGIITYGGQGHHAFRIALIDPAIASNGNTTGGPMPYPQTVLNNPSLGFTTPPPTNVIPAQPPYFPGWDAPTSTQLPLAYVPTQLAIQQRMNPYLTNGNGNYTNWANYPITLDGRWLHAFNGPGMGTQSTTPFNMSWSTTTGNNYNIPNYSVPRSTYGNFRYNGLSPNSTGMDEDYDACDLENWFLAIQSADGQVMIPSFHRPGVVRYQDQNNLLDWDPSPTGFRNSYFQDSASRILRPVAADGHDRATFPDLIPDTTTGKITYDVQQRRRRDHRLGVGRPGLSGPPRRAAATTTSRCSPSW